MYHITLYHESYRILQLALFQTEDHQTWSYRPLLIVFYFPLSSIFGASFRRPRSFLNVTHSKKSYRILFCNSLCYFVMICCIKLCFIILCLIVLRYIILCYIISCIIPSIIILYYISVHWLISYHYSISILKTSPDPEPSKAKKRKPLEPTDVSLLQLYCYLLLQT